MTLTTSGLTFFTSKRIDLIEMYVEDIIEQFKDSKFLHEESFEKSEDFESAWE